MEDLHVVVLGVGAAGVACSKILLAGGRAATSSAWTARASSTKAAMHGRQRDEGSGSPSTPTPRGGKGDLQVALKGADLFLGLSGPQLLEPAWIKTMDARPDRLRHVQPRAGSDAGGSARSTRAVIATGRSDYPNQINNVLCFPGIFRGALDCRARDINETMKLAAADAIARCVPGDKLDPDYIIPSVFDKRVANNVAAATIRAAQESGVAQRRKKIEHLLPGV